MGIANLKRMKLLATVSCQLVAYLLVLAPFAYGTSRGCKEDHHSWDNLDHFTEYGLVPKYIPCQPKHTATIYYNADDYVLVGNQLTEEQVKNQPIINFPAFERRTNYTAILVDVDASTPENPKQGPFLHFLAVNSYEVIIGTSDIVAPYVKPDPPPGTNHRYVWLLFKQYDRIDPDRLSSLQANRENFSIKQFAAENNLSVPMSGNIFVTAG